ncbi:MAG: arsenate reductase ArsC [Silicimonas sp.]|nr:arsenate reductase ArsC [Silicimonas sp.]
MTDHSTFNVLFLCTGNSARSILAEAILKKLGGDRFQSFSAGSHPKDRPHPLGIALLSGLGHDIRDFRSKSWDEFAGPDAPRIDLIVTVCDNAAGEVCPIWPGGPTSVHWSLPDPADETLTNKEQSILFSRVYVRLQSRIEDLIALPVEAMEPPALRTRLNGIPELENIQIPVRA